MSPDLKTNLILAGAGAAVAAGLALTIYPSNQPDSSRQIHPIKNSTGSNPTPDTSYGNSYTLPDLVSPMSNLEDPELQRMINDVLGIDPYALAPRPISLREARQNFLVGVAMARQLHPEETIFQEPKGSTMVINGRLYDLQKPPDFFFANATLQGVLRRVYNHPSWGKRPPESVTEDITALSKRLAILNASVHPVVDPTMLADLNKGLDILESRGKKTPDKTVVVNNFSSADNGNVLTLAERGNVFDFLGWYYWHQEPALVEEFTRASVNMHRGLTIADDFVGTFREYLENGSIFRRRVLYAETLENHAKAQVLQAKYGVFRKWLGVDIGFKAYPKDLQDYQLGQVVWIEDPEEIYDSRNSGVYLRPEPRSDINPDWPNTRNGFAVKILAGPEVVINSEEEQAIRMYRVQSGNTLKLPDGRTAFVPDPNSQGWMPDDYLGAAS